MWLTARPNTHKRRADPRRRATHPADNPPQDTPELLAPEPASSAHLGLGACELDDRRMSYAPGCPRDVDRCERRRTEHTDDEREWDEALTGEMHDC